METEAGPEEPFVAAWRAWRAARLETLNAEDGPATLSATFWLSEADIVPGVPGTWEVVNGDVLLHLHDGSDVIAGRAGEAVGAAIRFPAVTVQAISRAGRHGIRVFDHALAGSVAGVDSFEPTRAWLVEGTFTPLGGDASRPYDFQRESAPRELPAPGVVAFALGGRRYETHPFPDDGGLLLVFADETTGIQTKPPGRFLLIPLPHGLAAAGAVTLDFNRAFLPPCAFSDQYSCPLPPPEHRLGLAITAGETWPRPRE